MESRVGAACELLFKKQPLLMTAIMEETPAGGHICMQRRHTCVALHVTRTDCSRRRLTELGSGALLSGRPRAPLLALLLAAPPPSASAAGDAVRRGDPAACPATAAAPATCATAHTHSSALMAQQSDSHKPLTDVTVTARVPTCRNRPTADATSRAARRAGRRPAYVSGTVAAGLFLTLPCSAACRASCLAGDSALAGFPAKRLSRVHGDAGAAGSCASDVVQISALGFHICHASAMQLSRASGNAAAAASCKWQDCWILQAWLRNLLLA